MLNMSRQKVITLLMVAYLAVITILFLAKNISITPDRLFILLLFAAVIVGRVKSFLRDWIPFVALILAYEMLRSFAGNTLFSPHITSLIVADKLLFFGQMPTEVLQKIFYKPGYIGPIDLGATLTYFLHFPLPFMAAFFFWLKDKSKYTKFVIALLVLSFAGFLTYLLFPSAPPWYAANLGLIHVTKITNIVVDHLGWTWNLSYYYSHLNPNPIAAMPSLHAAYPTLVLLSLRNYSKKLFWYFLPYPLLVWFSIVYLGEHYVIDVIAGVAYAVAAFLLVYKWKNIKEWVLPKIEFSFSRFKRPVNS